MTSETKMSEEENEENDSDGRRQQRRLTEKLPREKNYSITGHNSNTYATVRRAKIIRPILLPLYVRERAYVAVHFFSF